MTIIENCPIPSNSDISRLEMKIGSRIPDDFRNFLMKYNATNIREDRFFDFAGDMYVIQSLYPLVDNYPMSIDQVYDRLNDLFDSKYIAFADDPGGYQFILSINPIDYGKVYFYRYDQEWAKSRTLLANSFDEFINDLQPNEESQA